MCKITLMLPTNKKHLKMCLLFSSTEHRTDKGALYMRCDAALANYLFCSLSVISKLKLHMFFFSFNLPNFQFDPF